MSAINLKLSKIDTDRVGHIFEEVQKDDEIYDFKNIPDYIYRYNKKRHEDGSTTIGLLTKRDGIANIIELMNISFRLEVYISTANSNIHPLADFFPDSTLNELRSTSMPNAVFYIALDDIWYALTINKGYLFIGSFIDLEYPIDMARRLMDQSVKNTKERDITGVVYGRIQQFRTNQLAESQSIGTIWSGLDGYISEEIRESTPFKDIFNPRQKNVGISINTGVEIKSGFNNYSSLLQGLNWMHTKGLIPLTDKETKKFPQLDGIKEIKLNEAGLITSLEKVLATTIRDSLINNEEIDFDFSHKNFIEYQGMDKFSPRESSKESLLCFDNAPSANEVLKKYHQNGWLDPNQLIDSFLDDLKTIYFMAYKIGSRNKGLTDSILYYLHGEVEYDGKSYFFIDGRWYRVNSKFKNTLNSNFNELLSGEYFNEEDIPRLNDWQNNMQEGSFNELHNSNNFIVGDRALINHIELADILYIENNNIYIYHNKIGFGSSTRDVCSQILQSMTWLDKIRKEKNRTYIGEYYDAIIRKHYGTTDLGITRDNFIDKLLSKESEITYILGYAKRERVNQRNLRSNIAKFEILKLCKFDKRLFDFNLKILWIRKPD